MQVSFGCDMKMQSSGLSALEEKRGYLGGVAYIYIYIYVCVCVSIPVPKEHDHNGFRANSSFAFNRQGDAPHLKRGHLKKRLFRLS